MITKADPDSPFWTAAREASARVEQWPAWKRGVLERPAPVKTTITIPVTRAARVALQTDQVLVAYGWYGTVLHRQSEMTQGHVNNANNWELPDGTQRYSETEHARWAAQARKQRGLGS